MPTTTTTPTARTSELDAQAVELGARLRRMRHARGLTLVQLADKAGLSHPFLSQLERGHARPSMASLDAIAKALGSSPLELLAAEEPATGDRHAALVRHGEGTSGPYAEGTARLLAPSARRFQPLEHCADNTEFGEYYAHDEDEFLTVLAGSVEIDLDAEGRHLVGVGDSLYLPGGMPHRWRGLDGAYRLLLVKERPGRR